MYISVHIYSSRALSRGKQAPCERPLPDEEYLVDTPCATVGYPQRSCCHKSPLDSGLRCGVAVDLSEGGSFHVIIE